MIKCVLFDLDGTLLDTSLDFAYALEKTCLQFSVKNVDYQQLRAIISEGGQAMVELAFPTLSANEITIRKDFFLKTYSENIAKHTELFSGLEDGLQALADKNIPWGIVTNKPKWLTQKLISQQHFPSKAMTVISGDTLTESKPHPAPLILAAKECGVAVKNCLYLGDHPRDILAGKNANMQTGAALFGFLPPNTNAKKDWQADFNFETPHAMAMFLKGL
jgi:phosphoglycolate phosphatase